MRITRFGARYVDGPTRTVIAEKCPNIKSSIVYINPIAKA